MRRLLVVLVVVASALVGPAPEARAVELDELTCRGTPDDRVTNVGANTVLVPHMTCTVTTTTPIAHTTSATGSGKVDNLFVGLCTAGVGTGTILVIVPPDLYTVSFVVVFTNGVGTLTITDGSSTGGADQAIGSGTISTVLCCPIPDACILRTPLHTLVFTATLHDLI